MFRLLTIDRNADDPTAGLSILSRYCASVVTAVDQFHIWNLEHSAIVLDLVIGWHWSAYSFPRVGEFVPVDDKSQSISSEIRAVFIRMERSTSTPLRH